MSTTFEKRISEHDLKTMWNVASEFQKTLLGNKWKFEGDMNNYETPIFLQTFLKWVLLGPYDRYEKRKMMSKIDALTSINTQLAVQFVKIPKQINYQSNTITKVPVHTTLLKHH